MNFFIEKTLFWVENIIRNPQKTIVSISRLARWVSTFPTFSNVLDRIRTYDFRVSGYGLLPTEVQAEFSLIGVEPITDRRDIRLLLFQLSYKEKKNHLFGIEPKTKRLVPHVLPLNCLIGFEPMT